MASRYPESATSSVAESSASSSTENSESSSKAPRLPALEMNEKIGSGAFGDVWAAKWTGERDAAVWKEPHVAVKVPHRRLGKCPEWRKSFREEGKLVKGLNHPNIIRVHHMLTYHGLPYIVMELAELGDLREYMSNMEGQADLEFDERPYAMCEGIAGGMQYLEERGIVHRDLAARNVLVTSSHTCKICDFGLTRSLTKLAPETQCSDGANYVFASKVWDEEGMVPLLWSAPEAFEQIASSKSDVWSFGVLLWEVFSYGEEPYKSLGIPGLDSGQAGSRVTALLGFLESGKRLKRPSECRRNTFDMMKTMWKMSPDERPTFASIKWQMKMMCDLFMLGDGPDVHYGSTCPFHQVPMLICYEKHEDYYGFL